MFYIIKKGRNKMKFKNKISIFILAVLFSAVSFSSSTFAAEYITSRLKVEPKSIKNNGREWSIDISGRNVKEGDWATFRAENVSIIPGGRVDIKYNNEKIGEALVNKIYSNGGDLNSFSIVRDDENARPGAIIWQGKIVFNKNIEKYANFNTFILNNSVNYFSYVNRETTVETKIIGSTTLKGEDVKLAKQPLININKTSAISSAGQFISNNGSSSFGPTVINSKNNPIKSGTIVEISMSKDSSIRFDDKTYPIGSTVRLSKLSESIFASTPVNKYGVYFTGGPGIELKVVSRSETELVLKVSKDMPATDGAYRSGVTSVKIVDGSHIKNNTVTNIKHTVELVSPDGNTIDKKDFNVAILILGSKVETYAKILKPEVKPRNPASTPAHQQPATELSKDEASEVKVKAPNTGFEKSQNLIIPAFSILGVVTVLFFRKKSKLKL